MKKIIFATTNENKVREVRMMMDGLDVELCTMKEAGVDVDIVEDGTTFEENAIIKAKTIMEITGEIAIADDSGLEVDYLDGAPGIYSARFLLLPPHYYNRIPLLSAFCVSSLFLSLLPTVFFYSHIKVLSAL